MQQVRQVFHATLQIYSLPSYVRRVDIYIVQGYDTMLLILGLPVETLSLLPYVRLFFCSLVFIDDAAQTLSVLKNR